MPGFKSVPFTLGQYQTRACKCEHPRAFHDDEGRCQRCGYVSEPYKRASTRRLVQAFAVLLKP
jgi:uncharacterized paraquat-inducible protein A